MLYQRESVLFVQDMATPSDLLRQAIEESELTPTEIGRRLNYKHPYQAIYALLKGTRKLTPEKQEKLAEILNKPKNHFASPGDTKTRMEQIEVEWQKFLKTETASKLEDDDLDLLRRLGRQFLGRRRPTAIFFQYLALGFGGNYTVEELESALEKNERLSEHLAAKNRGEK